MNARERIKAEVKQFGSSIKAAKAWGVSDSLVRQMVRSELRPNRRVCELLGISWDELDPAERGRGTNWQAAGYSNGVPTPERLAEQLATAAAIRLEGMPKAPKPVVDEDWRQAVRRSVRDHMRRERNIREWAARWRARTAKREAAEAAEAAQAA